MTEQQSQDQWAIIELFGHSKIAGRLSKDGDMYRIDVPETIEGSEPGQFRFTRLHSSGAIYSITFVDEQVARLAAKRLDKPPITILGLQSELRRMSAQKMLPETVLEQVDDDDDDDDDYYNDYYNEFPAEDD